MRRSLLVLAVATLVTLPVDAAVLCVGRGGGLRTRDACKPKERQVDPATLGLQGPPGPGLVVKDANGALVGTVIQEARGGDVQVRTTSVGDPLGVVQLTDTPPTLFLMQVARAVNGTLLRFTVSPAGFVNVGPHGSFIVFDGPACTGQAYYDVGHPGSPLLLPRFLESAWVNGTTLYYRSPGSSSAPVTQRSLLWLPIDSSTPCPFGTTDFIAPAGRCCTDGSTYAVEGTPLTVVDLATLGLIPPFHVEAQ